MKRPAKIFVWVVLLLLFGDHATSQTFEDFKNQIREEYNSFEKETQQKFDNFVEQIDKEFAEYLAGNFRGYPTEKAGVVISKPKPDLIPELKEIEVSGDQIEYELAYTDITYQGPVYPGIKKTENPDFEIRRIDVEFLGWPLYFEVDSRFFDVKSGSASGESLANSWSYYATLNYNHFLYQISEAANIMNLNSWGYYQLIKECSQSIYPESHNSQIAFQWIMLNKSRYMAKIGFSDNELFLLLPSIYKMYNTDFVRLNGVEYYIINGKGADIQTYDNDFPEADILMDVSISKPFYTNPIKKSRDYHFKYKEEKLSIKLDYDEEMIKFYNTIPLSDIVVYFNSVVCDRTKESVKRAFKPILDGKDEIESVNILLSFMQQAFGYKTDKYAYGTERYMFADEVLHYQFSDCEDRSVLFAYLVKTLLNKDIIALGFPGHMATAIDFGFQTQGSHLSVNGKYYYVADPTFFGAPVGIIMSSVNGEKAKVYEINYPGKDAELITKVWNTIGQFGGFKSDRLSEILTDNNGNIYVCGYFSEEADFNGITIKSEENGRDAFITKLNSDLIPEWTIFATGRGNDMGISISMDNENNLYFYGNFENDLSINNFEIFANGAPDVFVSRITNEGKVLWLSKAGIDKLDHNVDFMFMAKFNQNGEKIKAKLYSQTEDFDGYGLSTDYDGNAVIVGSFYATSGMNRNDFTNYDFGSSLDIPVALYETDIKLKQNEYEATIAGLFSALNLLKANSIEIQGAEIKSTFDTYNNKFSTYASGIYSNLARMKFVKNDKGIITIKTLDGKPILLDRIKISNDARIRIVRYKSGNILVEVLSGIFAGKGNYWLDMNSIKLFKESGDLLFNFDTDNSVKKLNLKKELLKKS